MQPMNSSSEESEAEETAVPEELNRFGKRASSSSSSSSSTSSWAERWRSAQEAVTCATCNEPGPRAQTIGCSFCPQRFHRTCIQPFWTHQQWAVAEREQLKCDDCADKCVVCGCADDDDDDTIMLVCDHCDDFFHWDCLDESARCPEDEIGDEDAEWYCPECSELMTSADEDDEDDDDEYGEMEEVDSDDMGSDECFTRSTCTCEVCAQLNEAADKWADDDNNNDDETDDGTLHVAKRMRQAINSEKMAALLHSLDNVHMRHGKPPPDAGGPSSSSSSSSSR